MTLKRHTLAEQAYEELRHRIVSGALPPGQRLLADELAGALFTSPTPVKEALALLERDGLVQRPPFQRPCRQDVLVAAMGMLVQKRTPPSVMQLVNA